MQTIKRLVDMGYQNQIMSMLMLYSDNGKAAGNPINVERTKKVIEKFKDHPGLFGWMIQDEPYLVQVDPYEDLKASYKLIRDLDPVHPTYMVSDTYSKQHHSCSKFCDIICV